MAKSKLRADNGRQRKEKKGREGRETPSMYSVPCTEAPKPQATMKVSKNSVLQRVKACCNGLPSSLYLINQSEVKVVSETAGASVLISC